MDLLSPFYTAPEHSSVVITTIVILDKQVIDRQLVVSIHFQLIHEVDGIAYIHHDHLATSQFIPHCLQELNNQRVQLRPLSLHQVVRTVPDNTVQTLLLHYSRYQSHCQLKLIVVAANSLEEIDISATQVYPRHQFDVRVRLLDSCGVVAVVIVLIFKSWLAITCKSKGVPAGTDIIYLMCIFEGVLEALLVPRGQEEEFFDLRVVLARGRLISELQILQQTGRILQFQLPILLKSDGGDC